MGSCVSKKAARAGAAGGGGSKGKVAAPFRPVVEKESADAQLPPVLEVVEEAEEVKEVVLSETPAPRPPPEPVPVKRRREQPEADDEAAAASDTCSASDSAASSSVPPSAAKAAGGKRELEVEKRALMDAPEKAKTCTARRMAAPEETERESRNRKPKGGGGAGGGNGHGRARSPSPSSAHRRQQQQSGGQGQHHQHHPPRREQQPAVVSGIGCRSGRFSPSAARRAAESAAAVRRTHSAREADMALPSSSLSKRSLLSLNGNVAGHGGGGSGSALSRRDPGERADSPTGSRRFPASLGASAIHRPASPMRKAAAVKEHGTPERARPPPPRAVREGGAEEKKVAEGEEDGAALGHNNPSVAMECFIFL